MELMSKRGFTTYQSKTPVHGFTLIELLVVISIIAILAVVGVVVFTGIQKSARDAKRRGDIEAIAKAYEVKYQAAGGKYQSLADSDFASGGIPKDPDSSRGDYFNWLDNNGTGFKACASLDNNPNNACNTPADNCYCKFSSQGTIPSDSTAGSSSTHTENGQGGYTACDPGGVLSGPGSGLVGYWKMDEESWSGAANEVVDSSGNGINGTATGFPLPTVASGKFGNAGNFTTVGNYALTSGSSLLCQNVFTFSAWVKPAGTFESRYNYMHFGNGNPQSAIYSNQFITWVPAASGGWPSVTSNTTITAGTWYHVVSTFDGSNLRMYINGTLKNTTPGITKDTCSSQTLAIGSHHGDYPYQGLVDEAKFYNRALEPTEVTALYNNGSGCI